MPLLFLKDDITKLKVDAIVNAANKSLLGGGGVDGAIHLAAGPELFDECLSLNGCETGEAKITKGYKLPAKYVIHTVGPIWDGGNSGESELLRNCYLNSLKLAKENDIKSVAFPMISTGAYGYPFDEAMSIAVKTISEYIADNDDMTVYIVIYPGLFRRSSRIYMNSAPMSDLDEYISRSKREERARKRDRLFHNLNSGEAVKQLRQEFSKSAYEEDEDEIESSKIPEFDTPDRVDVEDEPQIFYASYCPPESTPPVVAAAPAPAVSIKNLDDIVLDEGPKEMLVRLIDERKIKTKDLCIKANIDKKVISKIRNDENYHPSKPMLLAFCIGLELDMKETSELLLKAGFILSNSSLFDIVVKYFIENRIYDIYELNIELFNRDQRLLGSA